MLDYSEIRKIATGQINIDEAYLRSLHITVRQMPMSYEIKAITAPYGSWYEIKINSRIPDTQKWDALLHELVHIVRGDCHNGVSAVIAEETNPY
jgi:hypothetical protein